MEAGAKLSRLRMITLLTGVLIISFRAPLIFVPRQFLELAGWLIKKNLRIRLLGIFILLWGGMMVYCSLPVAGAISWLILLLGWVWALAGLFLHLLFPGGYRALVEMFFEVEPGFLRAGGFIASLVGIIFILLGIYYT